MIITRGKDGRYSATQMSDFGRVQVADADTRSGAIKELCIMLEEQMAMAYQHEQEMTHFSIQSNPDGRYM